MRRVIYGMFVVGAASTAFLPCAHAEEPLQQKAAELAREFVGRLKPQLKQAMADGGPTHAVEVCASEAPKIAESLSAESGWEVRRVSLRQRNASRATPDRWERTVLQQFDQRQLAGEKPSDLHFGEFTGESYRYMQAQGAGGLCLTCHGQGLSPTVSDTLEKFYPDDQAIGYQLGQVRGAISLTASSKP